MDTLLRTGLQGKIRYQQIYSHSTGHLSFPFPFPPALPLALLPLTLSLALLPLLPPTPMQNFPSTIETLEGSSFDRTAGLYLSTPIHQLQSTLPEQTDFVWNWYIVGIHVCTYFALDLAIPFLFFLFFIFFYMYLNGKQHFSIHH